MTEFISDPRTLPVFDHQYFPTPVVYQNQLYYVQLIQHGFGVFSSGQPRLAKFLVVMPCGAVIRGDLLTIQRQTKFPAWVVWQVVTAITERGAPWFLFGEQLVCRDGFSVSRADSSMAQTIERVLHD